MSNPLPDRLRKPALAGAAVLAALLALDAGERSARHQDRHRRYPAAARRQSTRGGTGVANRLSGRAFGELDPRDPLNAIIQDIELGKDADGKVQLRRLLRADQAHRHVEGERPDVA